MKNKKNECGFKIAALISFVLFLVLPVTVGATTFEVCSTCTYKTITSALSDNMLLQDGDIINVRANTNGYIEPITVTKKVKLIGKTSAGADAWTGNAAGNSSSGPVIKFKGYSPMVSLKADNIEMKGFAIESITGGTPSSMINCINIEGALKHITMTYNTVTMGPNRNGVAVDNGQSLQNASMSYCKFIGPITNADSSWFYVGSGDTTAGNGGSVNGITLDHNYIEQSTSHLQLDNDIKNVTYSNNSFSKSQGYILISKPSAASGLIQGITITNNTFNSTSFANDYAVLIGDTVQDGDVGIEADAWTRNITISRNDFLQVDKGGDKPIVGFMNAALTAPSSNINATLNYWKDARGPKVFETDDQGDLVEISGNVNYSPWRAAVLGTSPMTWYTNNLIQPAIVAASNYDTIYIIANTPGYTEQLDITKRVALKGKKTNGINNSWDDATPTIGAVNGPVIKDKIKFNNTAGIKLQGLTIDTTGTPTVGSFFSGTVQSPTITFCTYVMGDAGDRGISVDGSSTVKDASISSCAFLSSAVTGCRWFMVDGADTGGSLDGATLFNNSITGATSELQLNQQIKNVIYSSNVFSNADGYILLSESSAGTTTNKLQNIQITGNTFNLSTRPLEYAVLVDDSLDDGDASPNWGAVKMRDNKFLQYDIGGTSYPTVGFKGNSSTYLTNIDAKQNWWYTAAGPKQPWESGYQESKVEISNKTDYVPWYGSATTADATKYVTVTRNNSAIVYSDSIQGAIDGAQDGDVVNVKKTTNPYSGAIVIGKHILLAGKKADGTTNAWTVNTPGCSSDAPVIKSSVAKLVTVGASDVTIYGFNIDSTSTATTHGMYVNGDISHLAVSYCSFAMKKDDRGIAIDDTNTARDIAVTNCSFTGEAVTSPASKWFYVGAGTSGANDGGSIDADERGYGARLSHNIITQATAVLQLDRKIKNVSFSNNEFRNSNGYLLFEKPSASATDGLLQGITITHNTFKNSTQTSPAFTHEYAVLVRDTISEADVKNDWDANFVLYFNNFEQNAQPGHFYPIVGFDDVLFDGLLPYITEIDAAHNWWNFTGGPLVFPGDSATVPDVSYDVLYDPYSRSSISGGVAAVIQPGILKTITDTSINMDIAVLPKKIGDPAPVGPAPVFAAKYNGNPVAITTGLPSAVTANDVFYDILVYPSSAGNINYITATFNFSASANSVYWYNAISTTWLPWNSSHISTASAKLKIWSDTDSKIKPSISQLTGTPICIKGAAATTTTTTVGTGNTTTSTGGGTGTTTVSATTTTTIGGVTTTVKPTSTSSVKTTTTTAVPLPKLTISPVSLNYGADKTVQTFTITNTGVGTLIWTINKDEINYNTGADWIFDITPVSGETKTEQDTINVTISRAGIPPGTYSATIPISSDGGDKTVSVSMEVTQEENPALNLNPRVLYLKDTDTSGTIEIANARTGTLVWTIGTPVYVNDNGIHWISSVTPAAGSAAAEKVAVSIEVNRDKLRGGIYIATLPVTSNGGNRTIGVVMFVAREAQQYPRTKVDPFIVFLKKTDVQKTFTISNAGTGTLFWQLGDVKYHQQQQGWITSASPQAGETTTEPVTITVNADSSKFGQSDRGLFGATIPVLSTGGNRNVFVYVWIPLLQYE